MSDQRKAFRRREKPIAPAKLRYLMDPPFINDTRYATCKEEVVDLYPGAMNFIRQPWEVELKRAMKEIGEFLKHDCMARNCSWRKDDKCPCFYYVPKVTKI